MAVLWYLTNYTQTLLTEEFDTAAASQQPVRVDAPSSVYGTRSTAQHSGCACVCLLQVLRDLVQVIRPDVDAAQSTRWTPRFMLRLDGIQQQTRVPAVCDLDTGAFVWLGIAP